MGTKITEKLVSKIKAPATGNKVVYDAEVKGFGVRITCAGAISFVLNYRIHGRERRYTIGRHPDFSAAAARDEAIKLRNDISHGQDPLAHRLEGRSAPTMADLAKDYIERHALPHKRETSIRNDRQMLDNIVSPRLGQIRVEGVTRRDIESLHSSLKATPYRANRVLALVSKMFSLAQEWGWRHDNPAHGIPRFHEDRRERWLTREEIERLSTALDNYSDQGVANAIRLLLLTGAREGEVLSSTWDQFDMPRGVWTKPSHHTKQKRIEYVPLGEASLRLLQSMHQQATTNVLFPGESDGQARTTLRRPWVQVCKAAGLAEEITVPGKRRRKVFRYRPKVRIHDLRHSFASHLVSQGISLHIVGKLLGHTQPQTTARYAHLADDPLREAANRFGQVVEGK